MHIMSLQTLKDLSRLRKKRRLWPLLYTASMLADHSSLLSSITPQVIAGLNGLYLLSINADGLAWSFIWYGPPQQGAIQFFLLMITWLHGSQSVCHHHCSFFRIPKLGIISLTRALATDTASGLAEYINYCQIISSECWRNKIHSYVFSFSCALYFAHTVHGKPFFWDVCEPICCEYLFISIMAQ